ncbi:MAG: hypothetical protein OES09_04875 [Gammaproteobacteria bacterium]|nr:hypothetical protein [Gammaproteobacteria bacterium]
MYVSDRLLAWKSARSVARNCGAAFGSAAFLILGGCATQPEIRSTDPTPVIQETAEIPEEYLLDVGVRIFDPGLENVDHSEKDNPVFPEVRKAESLYAAVALSDTLQSSAGWGSVRVIPDDPSPVDVLVDGKLIESNGERYAVEVTVRDVTGETWFTREYEQNASKYAYDREYRDAGGARDVFQGVYNRIANDMLEYRRSLDESQIKLARTVSELKFAADFAPAVFASHLVEERGRYQITRLPADGDPMIERIRQIRERDQMFFDTLQSYYGEFIGRMRAPYQDWRSESYHETLALREVRRDARNRTLLGVASVLAGILAAGSDSRVTRQAGNVAILGGAYMVRGGFDKRAESRIHIDTLKELGNSLSAEVAPQVIELEDRTVTLTGTVENQYAQWREILREIYRTETGESLSDSPVTP